jgi:uncharacterized protein (TIRG00374 family)
MNRDSTTTPDPAQATAATPGRRRWLRGGLAIGGYGAIAALAWRAIDHERLVTGLRRLEPVHIAAILAISLLHIAGRAFRFHRLLLRNAPSGYTWTDGFAIFLIGLSTSAVTPARAGDFVKAQLVRRHGVPLEAGVGLVLIERMLDLLVLTGAILLAGFAVTGESTAVWSRAAVVLLIGLVVALSAMTSRRLRARVASLVTRALRKFAPSKAEGAVTKLETAFHTWDAIFTSPLTLGAYLCGSGIVWSIEFAKLLCVMRLLGSSVTVSTVFFVYPVSILAGVLTLLPFSEGVVGVTGVALLASLAHVDPALATIAVVLDRVASGLPPLLLAMTSSLWRRRDAGITESPDSGS